MRKYYCYFALSFAAIALSGCGDNNSKSDNSNASATINLDKSSTPAVDVHAHPSEGPHGGTLVELGNEEFHAEIIHNKSSVTCYILDSSAKRAVPIDSQEVTINVIHGGKPEQFKLAASPDSGDSDGKSSRFVLVDEELAIHIDEETAAPKLTVTINGVPYRGEIKHSHASHEHAHK
ncbi:MAG: hypothetical protein SGI77_17185 [Pirellulaceae bacterium]|nr:hypothetical protein [Pirellulaceae bacterium]